MNAEHGIEDAQLVKLATQFGQVIMRVLITDRVQRGSVFAPIHWTDQFASNARIDKLVPPVTGPYSGQPASKNVDVELSAVNFDRFGFLLQNAVPEKSFLNQLDYWCLAPTAGGVRIEFALSKGKMLPLDLANASISYEDGRGTDTRYLWDGAEGIERLLFISDHPVAVSRAWACEQLGRFVANNIAMTRILAGRPGGDQPDKGPIVCSCFSVGANQIRTAIQTGCSSVADIGRACQAGTNCGSCRSEIGGLLHEALPIAAE